MASVNKVMIIGNVVADVEVKETNSGSKISRFRVATNSFHLDKSTREKKESVEFHSIVCFGKQAELVASYVVKGSSVYVEGSLRTSKWKDKNGNDRYTTEIVCNSIQFLSKKKPGDEASHAGDDNIGSDDDIPF